ncbi:MAG: rod shape-determining protein MreD [Actinomycetota bacterium]|nr:rod shape-determining protein MreD [Actinomycetota bacterium]
MSPASVGRCRVGALVVLVAIVQTTFGADLRIAGVAPDLFLLLAIAGGLTTGPEAGAVIGFSAGLVEDLTLAATPVGLSALAWCLVGFAVGWARSSVLSDGRAVEPLVAFVATLGGVALFLAAGDLAGQSAIMDLGHRWLLRIAVIEGGWNAVLVLPTTWLVGRAARGMPSADREGRVETLGVR